MSTINQNANQNSRCNRLVPSSRRQTTRPAQGASQLNGYLSNLATGVCVPPWAEFVTTATRKHFGADGFTSRRYTSIMVGDGDDWESWPPVAERTKKITTRAGRELGLIELWRNLRNPVLLALNELGLTATVRRVDQDVPLADHHADLGGLVIVHRPRQPNVRYTCEGLSDRESAYRWAMREQHGLRPHDGLPDTPRAFVGQVLTEDSHGHLVTVESQPRWFDRTRTWLDDDGLPVLTSEPYLNAVRGIDRISRYDLEGAAARRGQYRCPDPIPVTITTHPGVWNDGTSLVIMRWTANSEAPSAESTPTRAFMDRLSDDPDVVDERPLMWLTPAEFRLAYGRGYHAA